MKTPITRNTNLVDRDYIQLQSMLKVAQYAVLLKCGKRTEALQLLLSQEQFLRSNKMTFELLEVLQLIKQHYEVEGNGTMAKEYCVRYYTTKDEFINKSRLGKMDEAKLNIELEQTRENIRDITVKHRMQTVVLWATVIIAVLVLTILSIIYFNSRRSHKKDVLLYQKQIALLRDSKNLSHKTATLQDHSDAQPTEEQLELIDKIKKVMESSPDIYNEGFTVTQLAVLVNIHEKQVSHVINNVMHSKFNTLLNEYRIKEACNRLLDTENYANYTIEGIASSLGYKSRANFVKIFKELVGLTPSAFQNMSRN